MSPRGQIRLEGICGRGHHGALLAERELGQEFYVDAELELPIGASDRLGDTVDYGVLAGAIYDIITGEPCRLIETLAHRVADRCLREPKVESVTVKVYKPQAPIPVPFQQVSVRLTRRREELVPVVLSLGANQGPTIETLQEAVRQLSQVPGLVLRAVSSLYRTAAVDYEDQPDFHNLVLTGATVLSPHELLAATGQIEDLLGRRRVIPRGPRLIDIDLIQVGQVRLDTSELTLPHPRAHQRGFVLLPWLELDPDAELLGHGPVAEIRVDTSGVNLVPQRVELP